MMMPQPVASASPDGAIKIHPDYSYISKDSAPELEKVGLIEHAHRAKIAAKASKMKVVLIQAVRLSPQSSASRKRRAKRY